MLQYFGMEDDGCFCCCCPLFLEISFVSTKCSVAFERRQLSQVEEELSGRMDMEAVSFKRTKLCGEARGEDEMREQGHGFRRTD